MSCLAHQGLLSSPGGEAPSAGCLCPGSAPCWWVHLLPGPLWLWPRGSACGGWKPGTCKCQPLLFATRSPAPGVFLQRPFTLNPFIFISLSPSPSSSPSSFQASLFSLSSSQSPLFLSLLHLLCLPSSLLFHFPPILLSHSPPSPSTLPFSLSFFQFMLFLVPFSLSFTLFSLPSFIS